MALEPFIPGGRDRGDESLACFIRRRLGSEALEAFIGPMLAGIYAGDPERMSLESVFPRLKDLEGRGGFFRSLRRGRGSPFVTLRGGLSRLTEGLARALPPGVVRTGTKVLSLRRENSVWIIRTDRGVYEAEAVIPTLPAWALAEILEEADMELACALREIPFASSATVSLIYARDELPRLPEGFGFLPAHGENLRIGGATFSSSKFPQRAPCGKVLIRCFFSGAAPGSLAEAPPETLVRAAAEDLSRVLGLGGAKPEFSRVFRWDRSNPQYTIGHALRLKRIDSCRLGHPGLYLAGCSYEGIGIPDCVRSGRRAGAEAFRFCSGPRPGSHQRRLAYV